MVKAAPPSLADEAKARAAFENGQYREAVTQYQRLLHDEPGNVTYRVRLAGSYEISGQPKQAEAHAGEVLKQDSRNVDALLMMGRLSGRRQDWATAKSYYEKAVQADRQEPTAFLGLGQALSELGDDAAADVAFEEYRRLVDGN